MVCSKLIFLKKKQVYHSNFNEGSYQSIGNVFILPLKTKLRGPAAQAKPDEDDVVDEALKLFKANVFFRNFEFKGNADRVLVYLLLYITDCLNVHFLFFFVDQIFLDIPFFSKKKKNRN